MIFVKKEKYIRKTVSICAVLYVLFPIILFDVRNGIDLNSDTVLVMLIIPFVLIALVCFIAIRFTSELNYIEINEMGITEYYRHTAENKPKYKTVEWDEISNIYIQKPGAYRVGYLYVMVGGKIVIRFYPTDENLAYIKQFYPYEIREGDEARYDYLKRVNK